MASGWCGPRRDPLGPAARLRRRRGPGDFVYFAPFVPHQERNLSAADTVDFVAARSDNERIAVKLDSVSVAEPETVF